MYCCCTALPYCKTALRLSKQKAGRFQRPAFLWQKERRSNAPAFCIYLEEELLDLAVQDEDHAQRVMNLTQTLKKP